MTTSSTTLYGRTFNTVVFTSAKEANEFMENNEYGVLKVEGEEIHLARMEDEGVEQ